MRLERLAYDKIKIFLTFDDLKDRGISKEELWMDVPKVHDLFREMILEASRELGFDPDGPVVVEVFSLPAQGMVIIVSKSSEEVDTEDESFDDSYIELQITLGETEDIVYECHDFEDVIQLCHRLNQLGVDAGTLISFSGKYFLHFTEQDLLDDADSFIAVLAEYGQSSHVTIHRLLEYGTIIMKEQAVKHMVSYFK
ncbi:genetic competence negative regulator [Alteribacter natronophilus]|uniref:genetic competence negative regulator n=1 Tax=Alteribacter natronophilus TaxID=2583810 RepID=UPI00110E123D|nr:genetic competence negative regulator [Alteribacter natronophilus]TMW73625.1 genetic competence negative regulator [Alteribacter natronophilus]